MNAMKKQMNVVVGIRNICHGFMLLEVLISILLFALGIVALVGLQGRSLSTTSDVQYRAEAIHFANAYVGKMWASGLTGAALKAAFQEGAEYANFSGQVTGAKGIPGAIAPAVTIVDRSPVVTSPTTGVPVTIPSVDVTVVIEWMDREGIQHNYTQSSSIGY